MSQRTTAPGPPKAPHDAGAGMAGYPRRLPAVHARPIQLSLSRVVEGSFPDMIRLMMLIERPEGWAVEIVALAEGVFPDAVEAELYVFSGEGGVARLLLSDGREMRVRRDDVEAICGWKEGCEDRE